MAFGGLRFASPNRKKAHGVKVVSNLQIPYLQQLVRDQCRRHRRPVPVHEHFQQLARDHAISIIVIIPTGAPRNFFANNVAGENAL